MTRTCYLGEEGDDSYWHISQSASPQLLQPAPHLILEMAGIHPKESYGFLPQGLRMLAPREGVFPESPQQHGGPRPTGTGALSYLQELLVIQPTQHQFMAQFHHLCWNTRAQLLQTVTQTGGRQAPWPSAKGFPAKGDQQGSRWRTPWGASMASCCVTYTWSLPFSGG